MALPTGNTFVLNIAVTITPGASGDDIASMMEEAKTFATRELMEAFSEEGSAGSGYDGPFAIGINAATIGPFELPTK